MDAFPLRDVKAFSVVDYLIEQVLYDHMPGYVSDTEQYPRYIEDPQIMQSDEQEGELSLDNAHIEHQEKTSTFSNINQFDELATAKKVSTDSQTQRNASDDTVVTPGSRPQYQEAVSCSLGYRIKSQLAQKCLRYETC